MRCKNSLVSSSEETVPPNYLLKQENVILKISISLKFSSKLFPAFVLNFEMKSNAIFQARWKIKWNIKIVVFYNNLYIHNIKQENIKLVITLFALKYESNV